MHYARRDDEDAFSSPTSGEVQAQAARSLTLLNAIETAVTRASTNAELLTTIAGEFQSAADGLAKIAAGTVLDPEGRASHLLHLAAAAAARIYEGAVKSKNSAQADHRLTSEDGVETAFAQFAAAAASVHDAVENYRDHLETLDALNSRRGEKVYAESDDMIADILAGR